MGILGTVSYVIFTIIRVVVLCWICYWAYDIRLFAIKEYGRVIHEFDPYFNFRATEYLVANGWSKFINWYDDRSWYPLGRPVGTTIYPGLQITAALLYEGLNKLGIFMSLNDVCVFVPPWFSVVTVLLVFGMAYEVTMSANAGVAAAFVMAIVPAHIMRSVGGGFDNESIAMAAMCATFFLWMRSLRSATSWSIGVLTGLSYIYMVAAWGGYIFVLNMIGVHAGLLVAIGRFSPQLYFAYSIFYVIGTLGAIQIPVVGLAPLKSLEQLGPMLVFFLLQIAMVMRRRRIAKPDESLSAFRVYQLTLVGGFGAVLALVVALLWPTGYFGPLSSRVRGLFVQHTHTGNPLVDSVAEHQATKDEMYYQFFHVTCYIAPFALPYLLWHRSDSQLFMLTYSLIAMYFSRKMNRLVLLLSPAASVLAGIVIGLVVQWTLTPLSILGSSLIKPADTPKTSAGMKKATDDVLGDLLMADKKVKKDGKKKKIEVIPVLPVKAKVGVFDDTIRSVADLYNKNLFTRVVVGFVMTYILWVRLVGFWDHSFRMGDMLSNPSIIMRANTQDGRTVYLDDFREAYWWIRDNTPLDARVMSWWDYGYQIAQISNRTTLADGNTWNHEHIALLGKCLVSPVKESHKIVRHLADYVLVWSTRFVGNPGDDVAKSPHMARIGGSVYKDVKASEFYYDRQGRPSKMMYESLVFNLVLNGFDPNVPPLPPDTYTEVYTSTHRMVRVYKVLHVSKKSKKYCAQNRGYKAWHSGKPLIEAYPPDLQSVLKSKEDFAQLEDFNAPKKTKGKKAAK